MALGLHLFQISPIIICVSNFLTLNCDDCFFHLAANTLVLEGAGINDLEDYFFDFH